MVLYAVIDYRSPYSKENNYMNRQDIRLSFWAQAFNGVISNRVIISKLNEECNIKKVDINDAIVEVAKILGDKMYDLWLFTTTEEKIHDATLVEADEPVEPPEFADLKVTSIDKKKPVKKPVAK